MERVDRPRILVPFDGTVAAQRVLRTVSRAALDEHAPLVVLCVIAVPAGRAADETSLDAEAGSYRALLQAREICSQEGVVATYRETYAPDVAEEIVRVADRVHAAVIALPLDERPRSSHEMSLTAQRVLERAHCTVLLQPVSTGLGGDQTVRESSPTSSGIRGWPKLA